MEFNLAAAAATLDSDSLRKIRYARARARNRARNPTQPTSCGGALARERARLHTNFSSMHACPACMGRPRRAPRDGPPTTHRLRLHSIVPDPRKI
jgi:hypothetical protein